MKPPGLLRRTRLARHTPLEPGSPPVRKTPLKRTRLAPSRPRPAVPDDVRTTIRIRAKDLCEIGIPGLCHGWGCDPSHRIPRGMGGTHGNGADESARPSNVMWGCRPCHDWIEHNPEAAEREFVGWKVRRGFDPAQVPVLYRHQRLVWLDNTGRIWDYEAGAA